MVVLVRLQGFSPMEAKMLISYIQVTTGSLSMKLGRWQRRPPVGSPAVCEQSADGT